MQGNDAPDQEPDGPGSLRALIDLINEVWAGLGTAGLGFARPALAGAEPGFGTLEMRMAVDVASVPSKAGRGRAARAAAPSSSVADSEPADMEEQHAETWRLV